MHAQKGAERKQAEQEYRRSQVQMAALQKAMADTDTKSSSANGMHSCVAAFPLSQAGQLPSLIT